MVQCFLAVSLQSFENTRKHVFVNLRIALMTKEVFPCECFIVAASIPPENHTYSFLSPLPQQLWFSLSFLKGMSLVCHLLEAWPKVQGIHQLGSEGMAVNTHRTLSF